MQIHIKDIIASGAHGCFNHEKENVQPFRVSVDIVLKKEPQNDTLEETVDWAKVRDVVIESIEKESFALVETLSQHIAQTIKTMDSQVAKVTVHIEKLHAWDNGVPSVTFETRNE